MTYRDLCNLLEFLRFNIEEGSILPRVDVMSLCLDGSNCNWDNFLFWRFAQTDALKYPELVALFKMRDNVYSSNQKTIYENFLRNDILNIFENNGGKFGDGFKNKVNDEGTHLLLQQKSKELAKKMKQDNKVLYDDIRKLVGDYIYEEIRYELNPGLGGHIAELYNLMLDDVGNLIDKKTFISACIFEKPDEIKLLINTLLLALHFDVLDDLMEEISLNARTSQFRNMFVLHERLLSRIPFFSPITEQLSIIETLDKETYDLEWIKRMHNLLRHTVFESINSFESDDAAQEQRKGYIPWDDSNLYILINGKEKFKNKIEGVDHSSSEAIQKQLLLSRQRLENIR